MVCLGNAMLCPVALCVCVRGSCFFALHACHRLPPASNLSHTTCPTYPHTTDSLHYTLHWTLYTVHNSFTPSMTSSRLKPQLNSFSQTCDTTFTHTQLALNWAIHTQPLFHIITLIIDHYTLTLSAWLISYIHTQHTYTRTQLTHAQLTLTEPTHAHPPLPQPWQSFKRQLNSWFCLNSSTYDFPTQKLRPHLLRNIVSNYWCGINNNNNFKFKL